MATEILLSSMMPFPPIRWWQLALNKKEVLFDADEYYQKMSFRNRYYLAGSNGKQLLSLPLSGGRNQKKPMKNVTLAGQEKWMIKHWRTLQTCYGRSPFFEFFAPDIKPLFKLKNENIALYDWCLAGIKLINHLLDLNLQFGDTKKYQKEYPQAFLDIRLPSSKMQQKTTPNPYHQMFLEKTGFLSGCSILDLLFCEGMQSIDYLRTVAH